MIVNRLTEQQKQKCITLYQEGELSTQEIMDIVGIRSTQTIYRVLAQAGIELQRPSDTRKASISFDEEAWSVIERKKPRNLSKFVCKAIKGYYKKTQNP